MHADDAERLAQRVVERALFHRMRFARPLRDRGGEEAQVADRARNVERLRASLTVLPASRDSSAASSSRSRSTRSARRLQQSRAFFGRRRSPTGCSAFRGSDGVRRRRPRRSQGTREHVAGRGFEHVEIAATERRLQAAVDQVGESRGFGHVAKLSGFVEARVREHRRSGASRGLFFPTLRSWPGRFPMLTKRSRLTPLLQGERATAVDRDVDAADVTRGRRREKRDHVGDFRGFRESLRTFSVTGPLVARLRIRANRYRESDPGTIVSSN